MVRVALTRKFTLTPVSDPCFVKVTITVNPVNDAPIARDATFHVQRDGATCIDFACLVADADGDALSLSFANPSHGTLTRTDDGRYHYRPAQGFVGTDTFTYTVSDGQLSTTGIITLAVGGWACGNSATLQVTSGWASAGQTDSGYRYIVVTQGGGSPGDREADAADDVPMVDWGAKVDSHAYVAPGASSTWWRVLGGEPVPGPTEFAQRTGLSVKKPH
jgi:hypothetical protein